MAALGAVRGLVGDGIGLAVFAVFALLLSTGLWWFSAWFLLLGEVRWRVLLPSGLVTGLALSAYGLSASIWMPSVVTDNEAQFGFFGVAPALVTWFSGAATCILVGTCTGPVFAEDTGPVGTLVRGGKDSILTPNAAPSLPPPTRELTLRDAFQSTTEA
jgi:hypothetical protein